jgi:hypothetical protein
MLDAINLSGKCEAMPLNVKIHQYKSTYEYCVLYNMMV